jgi:mannose-6-phosphate isomerase-like protein (cupin superfamily)
MKTKLCVAVAVGVVGLALRGPGAEPSATVGATVARIPGEANAQEPIFKKLSDLKWDKILPDLGESSPEICILRVDPKTQATSLLIRTPKAIHVRKHWHNANETHTMIQGTATLACDGKRAEIGPGGFNFMPAKMVHEAWLPANSLTFITVDSAWDINWVEGPPTSADLSKTH